MFFLNRDDLLPLYIYAVLRIRESASGNTDPVPDPNSKSNKYQSFFFCNFSGARYKTHNDVFFVVYELIIHVY